MRFILVTTIFILVFIGAHYLSTGIEHIEHRKYCTDGYYESDINGRVPTKCPW